MNGYWDQLRRSDVLIETLRRRNGELFEALQVNAPDAARELTPLPDWSTRYAIVDQIVSVASRLALAHADVEPIDALLDQLVECVREHEEYWRGVEEERERRQEIVRKANKAKREKSNA